MKYHTYFLLRITCLIILPFVGLAQQQDLKFRHLDTRDGLPSSVINVVTKDHTGFVWIGTRNGLCRYDGFEYKNFSHQTGVPGSLPDNYVTSIMVTNDNQLWVGTNKGICIYNRYTGRFDPLRLPGTLPQRNRGESFVFLQDKKGLVWFTEFADQSLVGFDPVTGQTKLIDFFNNDGSPHVSAMMEDDKGIFWIARYGSIYRYDPETHISKRFISQHNRSDFQQIVTGFIQGANGTIWMTTWGSGLEHFDPATGKTDNYLQTPVNRFVGTTNVMGHPLWIRDPATGKAAIWLVSGGLLRFDTATKKFDVFKPDVLNPYANRLVYTVSQFPGCYYDSSQQMMWTWSPFGIDIGDFTQQVVKTFRTSSLQPILHTGSIDGFINNTADPDEYLFSFFAGNRVYSYHESSGKINYRSFPLPGISALFQVSRNLIWMSSERKLWEWNRSTNQLRDISIETGLSLNKIAASHRVNSFLRSHDGIIWIGSNGGGIDRFDPVTKKKRWLSGHDQQGSVQFPTPQTINQLVEISPGHLYALDQYKGLFRFSTDGKIVAHWQADEQNKPALENSLPLIYKNMAFDGRHDLWLNTSDGIFIFDLRTQKFTHPDPLIPFPLNTAENIAIDQHGYVWLSYADQLLVFNPKTREQRLFNRLNGYEGSPDGANFLVNTKGELRIGYEDHIEMIAQDPFYKTMGSMPKVLLTHIAIGGAELPEDDPSLLRRRLEVSYQQNEISFSFSLPLYHHPEKLTFQYRLDGFDTGWINAGNQHSVRYTNLSGGKYKFHVKAYDPDSHQFSGETSIDVVAYPPFWKTIWFLILVIAIVVSAAYVLYRYRVRQLLRIERMRLNISSDLHDELGATLSSISLYSHVARSLAAVDPSTTEQYLQQIEKNSREMIESMSDIVWSINPANDNPDKLLDRMRNYAHDLLGAAEIKVDWQQPADLHIRQLSMDQRKNLYLIFKEAINNIGKYSKATLVIIRFSMQDHAMQVMIQDNGQGFDTVLSHSGNGLTNMHHRAKLLHGQLAINSQPGNGTIITVVFPIV